MQSERIEALRVRSPDVMEIPIPRPRCGDARPMTPQKILKIIEVKGYFEVAWTTRNSELSERCRDMVKAGLIRRQTSKPGMTIYGAPEPAEAAA